MKLDRVIAVRNDKTIFRDGKNCVKIFTKDHSKARVFAEALNHAKIEEHISNVPGLLEVIRHNGCWAIVFDFIKGKTLAQRMMEEPEKLSEHLALLVSLQTQIHSQSCASLEKMHDHLARNILNCQLDPSFRNDLLSKLEKMPIANKICHGDLEPTNIIVADNGKAYVIDWSKATRGDPAADAALTYLLFRLEDRHAIAKEYLDLFCARSGLSKKEIIDWIPIVAAARSRSERENIRTKLLAWVNIID